MPAPQIERDQWPEAARAPRSSLAGPPSPGAVLGSFVTLIERLVTAQTQLISSYMRIGTSIARRSRPAASPATTRQPGLNDDRPAPAPTHSDPASAPTTDSIEARAYEIFVQRAGEPGNPVDDWRRAEAELRGGAG